MKHFQVHFFCVIAIFIILAIGRATYTVDFGGMMQQFKNKAAQVKAGYNQAYDQAKSYVTQNVVTPVIKKMIQSQERAITENPYKNTIASVRMGNELCAEEQAFLSKRTPYVKIALEKMLHRQLQDHQVPTIALIGSGGGYRAMLCTTGFLCGADTIGLLDATTYITALSGSTWALGAWIATGLPIADFRAYLIGTIVKNIHKIQNFEAKEIIDVLATKLSFEQPITIVDLYGGLLANRLLEGFGTNRQLVYLSHQARRVANGTFPYPIYTAVDGSAKVAHDASWYEFTPHEIGSSLFALYVPTWAFGRKFYAGQSLDYAPEQSLGFLLGTFGSAFAVHFGRAWEEVTAEFSDNFLKQAIEEYVLKSITGNRVFWAEVYNYMKGMSDIANTYERLNERETLKMVDAGLAYNLPYPPISGQRPERFANIMIFLDSSAGKLPNEFMKVEAYARQNNLKFPKIEWTDLDKKTISIFKDETDPTVPVVIYMPRISDPQLWEENKANNAYEKYNNSISYFDMEVCTNEGSFCTTASFKYTESQSQQIVDLMEFNMIVNKDKIIDAITWVIDQQN
jgi:phospholipase A2